MPSIINSTTTNGIVVSGDNSGSLQLQNSGVTELTVASTGVTVTDDLLFNSGYGSAAVAYGCRAWVNFNGTGTVAIRGSGNVSSITDNGTGDYTVNFTTAMPDVNYAVSGSARYTTSTNSMYLAIGASGAGGTYSTSAVQVRSVSFSNGADFDCDIVNVAVFR
jgi:hypothetical protein